MSTPNLFPLVGLPLFDTAEKAPAAAIVEPTELVTPRLRTLAELVDELHPRRRGYGYRYQNGIKPGPDKFAQFVECLRLQNTPPLYSQESLGDDAIAHVKLFDPCGASTWFITEWSDDVDEPTAFGLCYLHEAELGYMDLRDLAHLPGRMGIGIELDMHWTPRALKEARTEL